MLTFISVAILAAFAVVIWNVPDNGLIAPLTNGPAAAGTWTNPWDDVDTETVTATAQEWLETDSGANVFGEDVAGPAVPVFNENKELALWIVPVVNEDGLYTGFLQSDGAEFDGPSSYTEYLEPLNAFMTRDSAIYMHTYFILKHWSDYAPEKITEPFVVLKSDGGFFWMIEIIENGQVLERFFSGIRLVE